MSRALEEANEVLRSGRTSKASVDPVHGALMLIALVSAAVYFLR